MPPEVPPRPLLGLVAGLVAEAETRLAKRIEGESFGAVRDSLMPLVGNGYDATRTIVPELRRDIVEEIGPAAYAVPMENVFVAVPIEFAGRIADKVLRDFTTTERPVSPKVFVERGGKLVPDDR